MCQSKMVFLFPFGRGLTTAPKKCKEAKITFKLHYDHIVIVCENYVNEHLCENLSDRFFSRNLGLG